MFLSEATRPIQQVCHSTNQVTTKTKDNEEKMTKEILKISKPIGHEFSD
jgi:hypothetical protein